MPSNRTADQYSCDISPTMIRSSEQAMDQGCGCIVRSQLLPVSRSIKACSRPRLVTPVDAQIPAPVSGASVCKISLRNSDRISVKKTAVAPLRTGTIRRHFGLSSISSHATVSFQPKLMTTFRSTGACAGSRTPSARSHLEPIPEVLARH